MSQNLQGVIAGLVEYLNSDPDLKPDPIGYLEGLLSDLQELAAIDELYGQEVGVRREWGFRYRLSSSDTDKWTDIGMCTHEEALQAAYDVQNYDGEVRLEILARMRVTGQWQPQNLKELAAQKGKQK